MRFAPTMIVLLSGLAFGACSDTDADQGASFSADAGEVIAAVDAALPSDVTADAALPESGEEDAGAWEFDLGEFPVELACSLEEVRPILECVADKCADAVQDGTLATCMTFRCGLLFLGLPQECSQCIFAAVSDPSMALDSCVLGLDDLGLPSAPQP